MLALLLSASLSASPAWVAVAIDSPEHRWLKPCGRAAPPGFCKLPAPTRAEAESLLGTNATASARDGDELTIVSRRSARQAYLCCAVRGRMDRIADGLWGLRLKIAELDRGIVDLTVAPSVAGETSPGAFRGPQAPPRPAYASKLQGRLVRVLVHSRYLRADRNLTIYLPPGFDPRRRYPAIYAADGVFRESDGALIEALILQGRIPPLVMVGVWPGLDPHNANLRSQEYLWGWTEGAGAFLRHEAFFLKEVMPLAEAQYGASPDPEDRLVTGYSSGAAWALQMGLRHPDLFGRIAAMSFGWEKTPQGLDSPTRPRLFLSSGSLEPMYDARTQALAVIARRSPRELVTRHNVAGHSGSQFDAMEVEALTWAFGRRPAANATEGRAAVAGGP